MQNLKEKREVEDIKKTMHSHSRNLMIHNEKILKGEVEVRGLKDRIDLLEENSGTGGQGDLSEVAVTGKYNDLLGRPDEFFEMGTSFKNYLMQHWGISKKGERTKDFWFSCAVDSVIEGSVKIVYRCSRRQAEIDENIQFLLNNEVLCQANITSLATIDTTQTFEFKIRPKKGINSFAVNFTRLGTWSGDLTIGFLEIDIPYGKNVFFLSRSFNWYATVYKDKYLITKNGYPNIELFAKNKDDFDFTSGGTLLDARIGKHLIPCFSPYYSSNSVFLEMSYDEILAVGFNSDNYYPNISIYATNITQKLVSPEVVHAYSVTYFRHEAIDYSCPGLAVVAGNDRKLGFLETPVHHGIDYYTLNGLPVEGGVWVDNSAVMKQDMEGVIARDYRGSVGMKFNGECIFFPHIHSQYVVSLGFGRRVNAFLQDNGNINVYLGRQNHVVKKVLVKNEETQE